MSLSICPTGARNGLPRMVLQDGCLLEFEEKALKGLFKCKKKRKLQSGQGSLNLLGGILIV